MNLAAGLTDSDRLGPAAALAAIAVVAIAARADTCPNTNAAVPTVSSPLPICTINYLEPNIMQVIFSGWLMSATPSAVNDAKGEPNGPKENS
jgi:hypothetical protein